MDGNCVLIPLSKSGKHAGKYTAIVDAIDGDLADLNWQVSPKRHFVYAIRRTTINGRDITRHMHRIIMERILERALLDTETVDHINRIGADNRRENLRIATASQNEHNKSEQSNNTSGYKGVYWHKSDGYWHARIALNKKRINLGYFGTALEAHHAYCEAAVKYHGEFANFGSNSPFTHDMFTAQENAA